jgi:cysteinyl-tRNA synthetase
MRCFRLIRVLASPYSQRFCRGRGAVFQQKFDAALLDDMNTPEALAAVFDASRNTIAVAMTSLAQAARAAWITLVHEEAAWAMRHAAVI